MSGLFLWMSMLEIQTTTRIPFDDTTCHETCHVSPPNVFKGLQILVNRRFGETWILPFFELILTFLPQLSEERCRADVGLLPVPHQRRATQDPGTNIIKPIFALTHIIPKRSTILNDDARVSH